MASTAAAQSPWTLHLLGGIELRGPDSAAAERIVVQPKHVALLAFLCLEASGRHPRLFHRRDYLAALLWPELDQSHARASLRRVVHNVRAALGRELLISRGDEDLGLGETCIASDVGRFTDAVARGRLQSALEIYAGELMPGFHLTGCSEFEQWVSGHRENLRQEAAATAWALAEQLEADGEPTQAGKVLRKALKFSWEDERVIRRALVMLDRLGDHVGALRLFDEFSRWLRAEYDASPAPETLAVIERIRSQ